MPLTTTGSTTTVDIDTHAPRTQVAMTTIRPLPLRVGGEQRPVSRPRHASFAFGRDDHKDRTSFTTTRGKTSTRPWIDRQTRIENDHIDRTDQCRGNVNESLRSTRIDECHSIEIETSLKDCDGSKILHADDHHP